MLTLEFNDEPEPVEGEHQVDSAAANVLRLDCEAVEPAGAQPPDEVLLKVSLDCAGVKQVPGVAAFTTFLRIEASGEESDDRDDDRLELLADGALVVGTGAQPLTDVFDDLVYNRVDFGALNRLGIL